MKELRFDLERFKLPGLASFCLREATGVEELAAAQRVPDAAGAVRMQHTVAECLVAINDESVEPPYLDWIALPSSACDFIRAAFMRMNEPDGATMTAFEAAHAGARGKSEHVFSLAGLGLDVESFTMRLIDGHAEIRASERCTSPAWFRDCLIGESLVAADGASVKPDDWREWTMRTRRFVYRAFAMMNDAKQEDIDDFLAEAFASG